MSYKLKTLIVFDTNSLRSTDAGEVAYSFFAFGRPFQIIEEFILEKNLADDIHIAVPTWAIEELKDQKQRQYKKDVGDYLKLINRLMGMPGLGRFNLPSENFDCKAYIQEKADEYLENKRFKLLEIKEEIANTVLRSMMTRVMKEEKNKQPFVHATRGKKTYKDAGFKDNLIWESLLNFDEVENYDKIIFVTADSDYTESCKKEFQAKWNKHFAVFESEMNVLADIQKDYDNYIKERAIHDFAQTEYFIDYLKDGLKVKSIIVLDDNEYKIENYSIVDFCQTASRLWDNELQAENILIISEVKIFYSVNGEKKEKQIEITTTLFDEETKDIMSTEYDIELR